MKTKTTTVWQTDDGKEFIDFKEAKNHELLLRLTKYIEEKGINSGGEWSQSMIVHQLVDDAVYLAHIFSEWDK